MKYLLFFMLTNFSASVLCYQDSNNSKFSIFCNKECDLESCRKICHFCRLIFSHAFNSFFVKQAEFFSETYTFKKNINDKIVSNDDYLSQNCIRNQLEILVEKHFDLKLKKYIVEINNLKLRIKNIERHIQNLNQDYNELIMKQHSNKFCHKKNFVNFINNFKNKYVNKNGYLDNNNDTIDQKRIKKFRFNAINHTCSKLDFLTYSQSLKTEKVYNSDQVEYKYENILTSNSRSTGLENEIKKKSESCILFPSFINVTAPTSLDHFINLTSKTFNTDKNESQLVTFKPNIKETSLYIVKKIEDESVEINKKGDEISTEEKTNSSVNRKLDLSKIFSYNFDINFKSFSVEKFPKRHLIENSKTKVSKAEKNNLTKSNETFGIKKCENRIFNLFNFNLISKNDIKNISHNLFIKNLTKTSKGNFIKLENKISFEKENQQNMRNMKPECKYNYEIDCYGYYKRGYVKNTILNIRPKTRLDCNPIKVFCDMKSGGYTLIMRRFNGELDFYRNWTEYKNGFGDVLREFWIGNDMIHFLTNQYNYSLRIEFENWNGVKKIVDYEKFLVKSEEHGYELNVDGFNGNANAGDSLSAHNGYKFSTYDVDNDELPIQFWNGNCAKRFHGGWWYGSCYKSNLNGRYYKDGIVTPKLNDGISWNTWLGNKYSLKTVELKIKRNFRKK